MRIIAGTAKGRRLKGPPGLETRPPTDRLREAVFSSLGAAVAGSAVLDLFAGSGSFGLESLSRGAASATFVERHRRALAALRHNIEAVGLGGTVIASDVRAALGREQGRFDLVFVDPPYAIEQRELEDVLAALAPILTDGAIVLVHRRRGAAAPETPGTLALADRRRYGDAEIWRYDKEAR